MAAKQMNQAAVAYVPVSPPTRNARATSTAEPIPAKTRRAEEPAQSASTAVARAAEAAVQDTGTGRRTTREGCSRSRTVLRRRAARWAQGWMKATGRWVRG